MPPESTPWLLSRRHAIGLAAGAIATGLARPGWAQTSDTPSADRFPALTLQIGSPPPGAPPAFDLRQDFGAAGDGSADDGIALRQLAAAVNSGQVPANSLVRIPAGQYRVLGNETIVFRRPIVLRGDGPGQTILMPEYTQQRLLFLRALGDGMYTQHSSSLFSGRQADNRYPNAPYSDVAGTPARGTRTVAVANPAQFNPGDHVYLLCDDYGPEIVYSAGNSRREHYLLKQNARVASADGDQITLDTALRDDFLGAAPRLYRWRPMVGFGIEHLTIQDRSRIDDSEDANTFRALQLDGTTASWVWDVHFLDNTSIPLAIARSRKTVVRECLFDGARHVGGGGNGYLPEIYLSDDCLVEYCTSIRGRHALICNWSCWGNVFRYNRLDGTPNTETHGEYNVENLYYRNDARGSRMEIGGGGDRVHGHDGPYNELRQNYAGVLRVIRQADRANRLIGNWYGDPIVDAGGGTVVEGNQQVPRGWADYPYATYCGHDHTQTDTSGAT
ncbi:MAG: glycosyl hydrolase family 28-related protein [Chloroflexota bacterium]